jgi:phage terminase large subunit-like protein
MGRQDRQRQLIDLIHIWGVVYRIQNTGSHGRQNNPDEVGHKEKQAGKNADDDIKRLAKNQMTRRQLKYFAIGRFKRFDK